MAREPAQRFASVADLGRALEPFAEYTFFDVAQQINSSRPPSAHAPGPYTPLATEAKEVPALPRSERPGRRRSLVPAAAIVVGCALLGWLATRPASTTTRSPVSDAHVPKAAALPSDPAKPDDAHDELPTVHITPYQPPPPTAAEPPAAMPGASATSTAPATEPLATPSVAPITTPSAPALIAAPSAPPTDTPTSPAAAPTSPTPMLPPGAIRPAAHVLEAPSQLPATRAPAKPSLKPRAHPIDPPQMRMKDFWAN